MPRRPKTPLYWLLLGVVTSLYLCVFWKSVRKGASLAKDRWRKAPVQMTLAVVASFFVGQRLFWRLGYDQLGLGQAPLKEFGRGDQVASWLYPRLPKTRSMAWLLKSTEILCDMAKAPLEARTFALYWVMPDAWAMLPTQPAWSIMEAAEKTAGALWEPALVSSEFGMKLSIKCIYGNIFRYGQALSILGVAGAIKYYMSRPTACSTRP